MHMCLTCCLPTAAPKARTTVEHTLRHHLLAVLPKMKLLTHNFLQCHIKGVKNGYPLKIEAVKVDERDADFDPDFLRSMFKRVDWKAFLEGAQALGCGEGLPESVPEELLQDDGFLQKFHHALLEVCLEEGSLVCPETGRRFPVSKGIPNMLLNEDEV